MAKYVALINWTEQGIHNAKASVDRVEQARAAFGVMGVQIDTIFWTMGRHDLVAILDAADDETVTAAILQLTGAGNVRSETLRAFTADEMQGVFQRLS